MDCFNQMVRSGCERSVITYSTLISACEKAGEWELALQLFGRMPQDGVRPNTITFNSLITACAQGAATQARARARVWCVVWARSVCRSSLVTACACGRMPMRVGQAADGT